MKFLFIIIGNINIYKYQFEIFRVIICLLNFDNRGLSTAWKCVTDNLEVFSEVVFFSPFCAFFLNDIKMFDSFK